MLLHIHNTSLHAGPRLPLRISFVLVILLNAAFAYGHVAHGEEGSQGTEAIESRETMESRSSHKKDRRARRVQSTATEQLPDSEQKSLRRKKTGRGARQIQQAHKPSDRKITNLHLSGSFEINFEGNIISRGEGSLDLELDSATSERLMEIAREQMDHIIPLTKDVMSGMSAFPETLRSTSEILNLLSDPNTQRNLNQVESLLRLFQQAPGSNSAKSPEARQ